MASEEQQERTFLQELKRRHVFGAVTAYVVVGWGLIQALDILAPAFNAPDWLIRAVATVLILAFPLVVVLAWEFDASRKGITRTTDDRDAGVSATPWFRRSVVALISLISLGSIWWVWSSGALTDETFAAKDEDKFPKIIAIDRFQTFTSEGNAWLGDGVANLVRDNLSQSDFLRVVSLRRWQAISEATAADKLLEAAADAGIRYLLQGEIIGNRRGFVLTVRLTDTRDGEQLDAKTFEVQEDASLLERATSIAQNTRALLKVPIEERVDVFAADFAAENPSAYRAFVGALDYWINFDFPEAERLLRAALEIQPDFGIARYYLAWVLTVQDRSEEATRVLAEAREAELSERERQYVDALATLIRRDTETGIAVYGELTRQYPNDTEAVHVLADMHLMRRDYDAALREYRRLADLEPEVYVGWSGMAFVNLAAGKLEAARRAIEKFAALAPDNPNVYVLRGDLNRAEANFKEAESDYELALQKGPNLQEARVSLATVQYLGGRHDEALATLDALIRDDTAVPRYRIDAAFTAGGILSGMARFQDAADYLELLEPQLRASEILLAKGLAERAMALARAGADAATIDPLLQAAIDASPGVPTRYLFARGEVEILRGDHDAARATAAAIRRHALPPDNPDRTEDKAADYLEGMAALGEGDAPGALAFLERLSGVQGHEYALYALGHAQALLDTGQEQEAIELLRSVTRPPAALNPRFDLELGRQLARLLLAEALVQSGNRAEAAAITRQLRDHWRNASSRFAPLTRLARLPQA